ncbi:myb-related protein Zm38-like [Zingiber officinale]|uniref:Uncharacterized protein n=1 Tax=Zingiber officinale TaxID=94328 RepID=A0A8J5GHF6_ZINOF|nr:myb-related protein Zm38-like [Zingiber officinale]KAG6503644.1 hypothetical protein ZIOFF_035961 [Zingiber officinale]
MGRSPCCEKEHNNKGAWTKEEDERLAEYIRGHGEGCWRSLPKAAGLLRCGKSCRLRWINYLRPGLKRGNFTAAEEELVVKLHGHFGNKWSLIARRLPGRTDNEIKNYWNTHMRRKLLDRGIDPATHRPIHAPALDFTVSLSKSEDGQNGKVAIGSREQGPRRSHDEFRCPDLNLDLCLSSPSTATTADAFAGRKSGFLKSKIESN